MAYPFAGFGILRHGASLEERFWGYGHQAAVGRDNEEVQGKANCYDSDPYPAVVRGYENEEQQIRTYEEDPAREVIGAKGAEDGQELEADSKKRR